MTASTDGGADTDREIEPERPARSHGLSFELPERGTGVRSARRAAAAAAAVAVAEGLDAHSRAPARRVRPGTASQPSRRWLAGFAASLAVCVVLAGVLAIVGVATLRDSRTGRTVTSAAPDEPGFEAFLQPTPTLALTFVHDGLLESVAVLALGADDTGGGVLLIPAETIVGDEGLGSLAYASAFGASPEAMRQSIEVVAGVGVAELVTVDDAKWAQLVTPVAPLRIDNPDDLDGFPLGPLELAPEEIGPYLRAIDEDASDLSRLARHAIVWETWLAAIAESGAPVPGEVDTGIGRFVRGLAAGPHEIATLPVRERPDGSGQFDVVTEERVELVVSLVPYPTGTLYAPRTLVRLLDGTGDQGHVARAAPAVVGANASVVVVGNADRFDYAETEIRYHQAGHREAAERFRAALGAGKVIEDVRPIDSFDVTIVLGTDVEDAP